ncbi:MAG TPA: response regulator transcription factor [Solirubrobacteraceae bacterium]
MRRLRILVLDPDTTVRVGVRCLLGQESWVARCICAGDADQAIELARRYEPHVALLDLDRTLSRPEVIGALRGACDGTRFLLAADGSDLRIDACRTLGVHGAISKRWSPAVVGAAIREVARGVSHWPYVRQASETGFRHHELSVLRLLAEGRTNAEIAGCMHLAEDTVKRHTRALYGKLDARNRASAVAAGRRLGVI